MKRRAFRGVLFDLDGTLIDSYADANACWRAWAESMGLGAGTEISYLYGRPRAEIIRTLVPTISRRDLAEQADRVQRAEHRQTANTVALPGVRELLDGLAPDSWGIVTSSDRELARIRLRAARLPVPRVLVAAEDVERGKPDPQGYLLGAKDMGLRPADVLVVEDSPVGITAARNAGMTVVAVGFSHELAALADADGVVVNFSDISLSRVRPVGVAADAAVARFAVDLRAVHGTRGRLDGPVGAHRHTVPKP
jgi:mannitol-1-/sugar-/sorbitol-6-phosphatase